MSWEKFAIFEVVLMVVPATAFPILYAFRRWYSTLQGRAIMVLAVGLALLVDFAVLYHFLPSTPAKPIVASGVYAVILTGLVWLNVALLRSDRDRRNARHPRRRSSD